MAKKNPAAVELGRCGGQKKVAKRDGDAQTGATGSAWRQGRREPVGKEVQAKEGLSIMGTRPLSAALLAVALARLVCAQTFPAPQDLVVKTDGFPEIPLGNVRFALDAGPNDGGVRPAFTASVVFDGTGSRWIDLKLRISALTSDGKTHTYEVVGRTDDTGTVTKFEQRPSAASFLSYKVSDVVRTDVAAVSGTRSEQEKREAFSGILAKDEGCMRDLLKIVHLTGLAQHKAVAEMVQYGCIKLIDDPAWVFLKRDAHQIGPGVLFVSLLPRNGNEDPGSGFALASGITQASSEQIRIYPRKQATESKP